MWIRSKDKRILSVNNSMKYTQLKYDQFDKYLIESKKERLLSYEMYQYLFRFDNGYGASVVKNFMSYGNKYDLFELAVIKFDGYEHSLCYDTEITDDVIGYLNNDEVLGLLERIKSL